MHSYFSVASNYFERKRINSNELLSECFTNLCGLISPALHHQLVRGLNSSKQKRKVCDFSSTTPKLPTTICTIDIIVWDICSLKSIYNSSQTLKFWVWWRFPWIKIDKQGVLWSVSDVDIPSLDFEEGFNEPTMFVLASGSTNYQVATYCATWMLCASTSRWLDILTVPATLFVNFLCIYF